MLRFAFEEIEENELIFLRLSHLLHTPSPDFDTKLTEFVTASGVHVVM